MLNSVSFPALPESQPIILSFIQSFLEHCSMPEPARKQVNLAAEQVFSYIVNYAYAPDTGEITVVCSKDKTDPGLLQVEFRDSGHPYNPLKKPTYEEIERKPGINQIGFSMLEQILDGVQYRYENGQNVITVFKRLPKGKEE